jgi:hypothetical protein
MSTLNIQVTYDDNVHQFNLVRENLNWSQLVTVLQSSIPQAANINPFVLYYGLDGEAHQVRDQDAFSQLLTFPDILGLHFYGNANQDDMKSVYILPPVNDAFKKLSEFVNVHYSELENNVLLSRAVALLASSMTLSPGNYNDEMKQLESWIKKSPKDSGFFEEMWKMRNKLMKKQGQKFFKKFAHGSHKFSPYSFMDKHHRHGFPLAPPHGGFGTEWNAFPGSHPHHPFGGRGGRGRGGHAGHMKFSWGRRGPHSNFEYPTAFFDMMSDGEQDDENIPTEINENTATVHKETAADESSSDDHEDDDDEEFIFELPFGGPCGRPGFGRGGFGGRGGRGGRFGRHGFGGPGFGGPGFGGPGFGGPGFGGLGFGGLGFGGPGFGGPGFERPSAGGPEFEGFGFEGPAFGPGLHGRGGFGSRGRGSRGSRGRGGHFGGPGRFEKEFAEPDFDFLKSFDHEAPHHMPPREHKHFYFA